MHTTSKHVYDHVIEREALPSTVYGEQLVMDSFYIGSRRIFLPFHMQGITSTMDYYSITAVSCQSHLRNMQNNMNTCSKADRLRLRANMVCLEDIFASM